MSTDIIGLIYTILMAIAGVIGIFKIIEAFLIAGGWYGFKVGLYYLATGGWEAGITSICLLFSPIAGYGARTSNFYVLTTVTTILGGFMGYYFFKPDKFLQPDSPGYDVWISIRMPGLISLLSLLMFIRCMVYFIGRENRYNVLEG